MILKRQNFAADYDFILYFLLERCFEYRDFPKEIDVRMLKTMLQDRSLDSKQIVGFLDLINELETTARKNNKK